jgi:hypothetical protein
MKVFCVGFNKTGTTSLHHWFVAAGLDSSHDATYQKRTRTMGREALRSYLDAHDAFSDGERANVPILRDLYPDAKFVLNTRPMRSWLESRVKHVFRWRGGALAPPTADDRPRPGPHSGGMAREYLRDPAQAISDWIDRREVHHRAVLELFPTDDSRLLVVDVTTDAGWADALGAFLALDAVVPDRDVIHAKEATADPDRYDLAARLAQIEVVLDQKAIPPGEWDNRVHIGFSRH